MRLDNEQITEILEEKRMILGKSGIKSSDIYLNDYTNRPSFKTRLVTDKMSIPGVFELQLDNENEFTIDRSRVSRFDLNLIITQTALYYESSLQKGIINFVRSSISLAQLLIEYDETKATENETRELADLIHDCDRTKKIINLASFKSHVLSETKHELTIIDPTHRLLCDYEYSKTNFAKTLRDLIA